MAEVEMYEIELPQRWRELSPAPPSETYDLEQVQVIYCCFSSAHLTLKKKNLHKAKYTTEETQVTVYKELTKSR